MAIVMSAELERGIRALQNRGMDRGSIFRAALTDFVRRMRVRPSEADMTPERATEQVRIAFSQADKTLLATLKELSGMSTPSMLRMGLWDYARRSGVDTWQADGGVKGPLSITVKRRIMTLVQFTPREISLLGVLMDRTGCSLSDVVRVALRELAQSWGVKVEYPVELRRVRLGTGTMGGRKGKKS